MLDPSLCLLLEIASLKLKDSLIFEKFTDFDPSGLFSSAAMFIIAFIFSKTKFSGRFILVKADFGIHLVVTSTFNSEGSTPMLSLFF